MIRFLTFLLLFVGVTSMGCDVPCPVHQGQKFTNCSKKGHLNNRAYSDLMVQYDQGKVCAEETAGRIPSGNPSFRGVAPRQAASGGNGGLAGVAARAIGALSGLVSNAFAKADTGDHDSTETGEEGADLRDLTSERGAGGHYHLCGDSNPKLKDGKPQIDRVYRMYVREEGNEYVPSKPGPGAKCESVLAGPKGEIVGRVSLGAVFIDDKGDLAVVHTKVKGSQLGKKGKDAQNNWEAWPPIGEGPVTWVRDTEADCECSANEVYTFIQETPESDKLLTRKYKSNKETGEPSFAPGEADVVKDAILASKSPEVVNSQLSEAFASMKNPRFYKFVEDFADKFKLSRAEVLDAKFTSLEVPPDEIANFPAAVRKASHLTGEDESGTQGPGSRVSERRTEGDKGPGPRGRPEARTVAESKGSSGESKEATSGEGDSETEELDAEVTAKSTPLESETQETKEDLRTFYDSIDEKGRDELMDFVAKESQGAHKTEDLEAMPLEKLQDLVRHQCAALDSSIAQIFCGSDKVIREGFNGFLDDFEYGVGFSEKLLKKPLPAIKIDVDAMHVDANRCVVNP